MWRPAMKGFWSPTVNPYLYRCFCSLEPWRNVSLGRIDRRSSLSVEEFVREYDKKCRPVLITDLVQRWPAQDTWSWEALVEKYGDQKFKTDEVVRGKKIKMILRDYERYYRLHNDDDAIYLFDPLFIDRV